MTLLTKLFLVTRIALSLVARFVSAHPLATLALWALSLMLALWV